MSDTFTPEEIAEAKKNAPSFSADEIAEAKAAVPDNSNDTANRLQEFGKAVFLNPAKNAANTLLAPIDYAAQKVEPYTGAPVRAAVGELQQGHIGNALPAAWEQMKAGQDLPSTPSGEDITYRGLTQAGMHPSFAEPTAKAMGPVVSGGLDLMNLIPGEPATAGVRTAAENVPVLAAKIGRGAELAGDLGTSALGRIGSTLTQGNLKPYELAKAGDSLSAGQLMFPGTKNAGNLQKANAAVGEARIGLANNPISVPGSGDKAKDILEYLQSKQGQTNLGPRVEAAITNLEKKLGNNIDPIMGTKNPNDLTLFDIDDIVRDLDQAAYTDKGYDRALGAKVKPLVKNSRAQLNNLMSSIPEGEMFQNLKDQASSLANSGQTRSKLVSTMSTLGSLGTLAVGASHINNPLAVGGAVLGAGVMAAMKPETYYRVLGAAKIPGDMAKGGLSLLNKAYESKSVGAIQDAISILADKYPTATEKLIRTMAIAHSREPDLDEDKFQKINQAIKESKNNE